MLKWFVYTFLKTHIEEIVDRRFESKMIEKYNDEQRKQLQERIQELRTKINNSTSTSHYSKQDQILPSSRVQTRSEKSELPTETIPTTLTTEKTNNADLLKAKLIGKKK